MFLTVKGALGMAIERSMRRKRSGEAPGRRLPAGANRWTMRDVMTFAIFNIVIMLR